MKPSPHATKQPTTRKYTHTHTLNAAKQENLLLTHLTPNRKSQKKQTKKKKQPHTHTQKTLAFFVLHLPLFTPQCSPDGSFLPTHHPPTPPSFPSPPSGQNTFAFHSFSSPPPPFIFLPPPGPLQCMSPSLLPPPFCCASHPVLHESYRRCRCTGLVCTRVLLHALHWDVPFATIPPHTPPHPSTPLSVRTSDAWPTATKSVHNPTKEEEEEDEEVEEEKCRDILATTQRRRNSYFRAIFVSRLAEKRALK